MLHKGFPKIKQLSYQLLICYLCLRATNYSKCYWYIAKNYTTNNILQLNRLKLERKSWPSLRYWHYQFLIFALAEYAKLKHDIGYDINQLNGFLYLKENLYSCIDNESLNIFGNCFNGYKKLFPIRIYQLYLLLILGRENHLHLFNTSCIIYFKSIFFYNEFKMQRYIWTYPFINFFLPVYLSVWLVKEKFGKYDRRRGFRQSLVILWSTWISWNWLLYSDSPYSALDDENVISLLSQRGCLSHRNFISLFQEIESKSEQSCTCSFPSRFSSK